MKSRQWRMRTTLMVSLLSVSLGLTAMSLLVVRFSVQRQIRIGLDSDLQHSLTTFRNLTSQKNEMLSREASLLADLPSLKALMATGDAATVRDGGDEFWQLSGSNFFALTNSGGKLYTLRTRDQMLDGAAVLMQMRSCLERSPAPCLLFADRRLYVLTAQRIFFGPTARASELGFILIGYAVDAGVAREVSEAAAAEVAFQVGGTIAASTLGAELLPDLRSVPEHDDANQGDLSSRYSGSGNVAFELPSAGRPAGISSDTSTHWLRLGREDYRITSELLGNTQGTPVRLLVLKSYDRASGYLRQLNRWMAGLGLLAVLLGSLIAVAISRAMVRPLERLVEGTRALGQGDFHFSLATSGAAELQELGSAFEHMRLELESKQAQLMESDRLATIGRMASSISHDLRHHLSAIYANAEFMSLVRTGKEERVELLAEVQDAVQNMTDLIESLLLFSRTGQTLHRSFHFIFPIVERTVQTVRRHPEARNIIITVELAPSTQEDSPETEDKGAYHSSTPVHAWVDARTLTRAVFNLILNACQAARQANVSPRVRVIVEDCSDAVTITIEDNGPGVPERIRHTMFQPFVSAGKENGTGLGLTLAQHIAQEHGGEVVLDASHTGLTRFVIYLQRSAWKHLEASVARELEIHKLEEPLPVVPDSSSEADV